MTPSINFNKLLADDEISIDVEGSRKQALVRVVDPFHEQLTVECESVQLTVAFRDVLPPPVFTPVVKPCLSLQSLMGTPIFTGDIFQWARFCNAFSSTNLEMSMFINREKRSVLVDMRSSKMVCVFYI